MIVSKILASIVQDQVYFIMLTVAGFLTLCSAALLYFFEEREIFKKDEEICLITQIN
jgi:hypothetical protein